MQFGWEEQQGHSIGQELPPVQEQANLLEDVCSEDKG
jgi:hypothetical protein